MGGCTTKPRPPVGRSRDDDTRATAIFTRTNLPARLFPILRSSLHCLCLCLCHCLCLCFCHCLCLCFCHCICLCLCHCLCICLCDMRAISISTGTNLPARLFCILRLRKPLFEKLSDLLALPVCGGWGGGL